mmetsp:Transcript_39931/g.118454  ORF Transcript_39931/g.118454 Transcript_39931/m.118454 type:complete len:262 (+) Transcript_39931:516-1301(+)
MAELWTMSALETERVPLTGSVDLLSPYRAPTPAACAAPDTKASEVPPTAPGCAPNIGRITTGCGVGMEAFGSPICAHAMVPPLMTISGFAPNSAGFHTTRSASMPGCTEPTACAIPWARAGLIVYFAMYRLIRALSAPADVSSGSGPRCAFILSAVCQVRQTTSPTRPIACESDDMTEMAPMSCRMSSAAIVSPRMRDSAKATSSGIALSRWWQTMSMSRCSSIVLTVKGRVGLVEEGRTFGSEQTLMMSGAWPPPAPSEW